MNVRRIGSLLLMGGLLAAAIGGTAVHAQQTVMLSASDFQFDPSSVTVPAGQPITFEINNMGERNHDLHIEGQGVVFEVVSGTGAVAPGQTGSEAMTFTTPGTYTFWCPVGNHRQQGMEGTLTVTAAGAPAAPAPGAPIQQPGALPRTGNATVGAPGAALLGGGLLIGLGWLLRRRGQRE